jgi:L-threonylcarbamoyladenylate synthase
MAKIGDDINIAKTLLEKGDLVAIPTETVYGLAGNALDGDAIAKIFQVKNRPTFNPLIIHSDGVEKIAQYVSHIPEKAIELAETFWPGALTMLLFKNEKVPDLVTAGSDLVAVRIPHHPLTLELLSILEFPLAAPSANPFGYISPTTAEHVNKQLGQKIPYILNGGPCEIGIESTIIGFADNMPTIYRLGGISVEDIESSIGRVEVATHAAVQPLSPGMLKSHYAPSKKLIIGSIQKLIQANRNERFGIISFRDTYHEAEPDYQVTLSESGDMKEAANKLFAGMRYLDKLPINLIFAELLPEHGLGRAINDRLKRAAADKHWE